MIGEEQDEEKGESASHTDGIDGRRSVRIGCSITRVFLRTFHSLQANRILGNQGANLDARLPALTSHGSCPSLSTPLLAMSVSAEVWGSEVDAEH
jgi:hypothetical protein